MTQHAHNSAAEHECLNVWHKWAGFLDNELDAAERARVVSHLAACGHCREYVDTQTRFNSMLRTGLQAGSPALPPGLRDKVLAAIEKKAASTGHTHADGTTHSHSHGEPGHVHDHMHSHGMSLASRAALAVSLACLLVSVFFFASARQDPSEDPTLKAKLDGLEKLLGDSRRDVDELRADLNKARDEKEVALRTADAEAARAKAAETRARKSEAERDAAARDLQFIAYLASIKLIGAARSVMSVDLGEKPLEVCFEKWKEMFPKAGKLPTVSVDDMKPVNWGVDPFKDYEVLWVVFGKPGDDKSKRFTLMSFRRALVEKEYGSIEGFKELMAGDMAVILWRNANPEEDCVHALLSGSDMETARAQLMGLK